MFFPGGDSDLGAGTGHHSKSNYSNGFASQLGNFVTGSVMHSLSACIDNR